MATNLTFEKKNGRYEASFVMGGSYCSVQINRNKAGALCYIMRDGNRNVPIAIPFSVGNKDVLVPLKYPEGTIITVVSMVPVEYGAVIGQAELIDLDVPDVDPEQKYYPNAVSDYDGNWYDAVIIGDQVWMAENLRSTKYYDGEKISNGWNLSDNYSYWLIGDNGYYYNIPAITRGAASSIANPSGVQGIAPIGWHVPSSTELTEMKTAVMNDYQYSAKSIASKSGWESSGASAGCPGYNASDNNASKLDIYPTGVYRHSGYNLKLENAGIDAILMSCSYSQSDFDALLINYNITIPLFGAKARLLFCSVRCVCDMAPAQFASWYVNKYKTTNHQVNNKYGSN